MVDTQQPAQWFTVQMPLAEARHLAGTGPMWPATPEARALAALRDWLCGITRSRRATVPVTKVVADLAPILDLSSVPAAPSRGPFGPRQADLRLPGRVAYLGDGIVRLDDTAVSALTGLGEGEDFRVVYTDAGPMLLVGTDGYLARAERLPVGSPSARPRRPRSSK